MYYVYQRVSTDQQNLQRQEGMIAEYCKEHKIFVAPENVYSDIITGKTINREGYQTLKSKLQKNDVLIMLDLDRLGRNWDLIKKEWKELTDAGIYIIIVNCPLINVLPDETGVISVDKRLLQEMMFTLLCYVSQKEVEKISIRTKEALQVKKANGVILGRPKTFDSANVPEIWRLYKLRWSVKKIAEELNISVPSVYRVLRGELK